jgi:hypothetical protein
VVYGDIVVAQELQQQEEVASRERACQASQNHAEDIEREGRDFPVPAAQPNRPRKRKATRAPVDTTAGDYHVDHDADSDCDIPWGCEDSDCPFDTSAPGPTRPQACDKQARTEQAHLHWDRVHPALTRSCVAAYPAYQAAAHAQLVAQHERTRLATEDCANLRGCTCGVRDHSLLRKFEDTKVLIIYATGVVSIVLPVYSCNGYGSHRHCLARSTCSAKRFISLPLVSRQTSTADNVSPASNLFIAIHTTCHVVWMLDGTLGLLLHSEQSTLKRCIRTLSSVSSSPRSWP